MNKKTLCIAEAGIIAALYVVLTMISAMFGVSSYTIQCRLGEALCLLPVLTPAAIPGVTIGCLIANLIITGSIFDIVIGTFATFLGALGAYALKNGKLRYLASFPTVLANAIAVPVIQILMDVPDVMYLFNAFTTAVGDIISCTILGGILIKIIERSGIMRVLKSK